MKPPLHALVVFTLLFSMDAEAGGKRLIPVTVRGQVKPAVVEAGKPIPLTITIRNELPSSIRFATFRLTPTEWNGETVNISLVDIYREGNPLNLYLARPVVGEPKPVAGLTLKISGMGGRVIKPTESLVVRTDARKWTLRDGWLPGRYKVTVRAEHLTVDRYSRLWVTSDPFEFEIKAAATRPDK